MLIKQCAMNTYFEVEVLKCAFLIMALDGREWPTSGSNRFTSQQEYSVTID